MILFNRNMWYVRQEYETAGYAQFLEALTGHQVLLIQADKYGRIPLLDEADAVGFDVDWVVCCYPSSASSRYPNRTFVGADIGFDGEIEVRWFGEFLEIVGIVEGGNDSE